MSGLFCFDIETLGIESTSCVLSIALVYCVPEELPEDNTEAYYSLIEKTCFVKFDTSEQIAAKRSMDRSTLDWWQKQGQVPKKVSFAPDPDQDVSVKEGADILRNYFISCNDKHSPVWVRGSLDQLLFESLLRKFGIPPILPYNQYRDVRTAISLIYPNEQGGYVDVDNFDPDIVHKHNPVADVCYDVLMLLRGKQ